MQWGGARLYTSGEFQTDNGRAQLIPTKWEPFAEPPNRDYPFVLNTGRTVEHWHTRTKTGRVPILERLSPRAWLEMNPRDGRALGLHPTERVDVVSRRGVIRNLDLRLTETVGPGQVFVPFHWAEANANQATQSDFDPISREPNYKQCAVRVERSR
jgi:assimilatory nitrate reductase catalytic subunit